MSNRIRAAAIGVCLAVVSACGPPAEITVMQATYGANCQAPRGNATVSLARHCDGNRTCAYKVDVNALGDPAQACAKEFEAIWRCPGEENVRRLTVPAEAGLGSLATLTCG